ncbi:MAG: glutamate--tRNA ligase [Pseudomonadota bacterium]
MTVKTRFAPSPTGVLHLGSVRTALFSWLYARGQGGKFVLRIEDTDRERSTDENVEAILDGMRWLGLDADEDPIFQTHRFDRYQTVIDDWLSEGKAYRCYCTREELDQMRARQMERGEKPRYDGRWRDRVEPREGVDPVVRFRNPLDGEVVVEDAVRGRVVFQNSELDDLIIARSDGTPTYNFTVVVDDHDMAITHVIRGDDHLNNTPRQMNMFAALDAEPPAFAHLPMILGADGSKLSKRHGAVDVREYRDLGYLPEAMLNYLARLGWSHGDQEVFSVDELIRLFDIKDVNQSASAFNSEKLEWINHQHLLNAPAEALAPQLELKLSDMGLDPDGGPDLEQVVLAFRERARTLVDMAAQSRYCFEDFERFDEKAAKKHLRPVILEPIRTLADRLASLAFWSERQIQEAIESTAEDYDIGLGKLGQPLRVAVTGVSASPSISTTVWLVGQTRTAERLRIAIEFIENRAAETSQ